VSPEYGAAALICTTYTATTHHLATPYLPVSSNTKTRRQHHCVSTSAFPPSPPSYLHSPPITEKKGRKEGTKSQYPSGVICVRQATQQKLVKKNSTPPTFQTLWYCLYTRKLVVLYEQRTMEAVQAYYGFLVYTCCTGDRIGFINTQRRRWRESFGVWM